MNGNSLYHALEAISKAALAQGYHPLTTILLHVFELPCSIYVHEDMNYMDSITHIPIAKAHTRREIFERLPLPFIIRTNRNKADRKTWGVKITTDYVITDKDHSSAYSMNKGDLETCLQIGGAY